MDQDAVLRQGGPAHAALRLHDRAKAGELERGRECVVEILDLHLLRARAPRRRCPGPWREWRVPGMPGSRCGWYGGQRATILYKYYTRQTCPAQAGEDGSGGAEGASCYGRQVCRENNTSLENNTAAVPGSGELRGGCSLRLKVKAHTAAVLTQHFRGRALPVDGDELF